MTKTHLISDEQLGGVLREYVEVDRKAEVGDKVVVLSDWTRRFSEGQIVEPTKTCSDGSIYARHLEGTLDGCARLENHEYKTLEPTDIIQIDGERYRMADRKANVGDKVIVINSPVIKTGTIGTCIANSAGYDGLITIDVHFYEDEYTLINTELDEYRVLEPLLSPEELSQPTDQLDIIARLTRKVAQLERDIEMVIDDIVTLDERTSASAPQLQLNSAEKILSEIMRLIERGGVK